MKHFILLLAGFLFSVTLTSQHSLNYLLEKNLHKDSVIKDLSILNTIINEVHPGQLMYCSKQEYDKTYDSLVKSVTSPISYIDFYCKASCLLAKVRDGHTWPGNLKIRESMQSQPVFPFSIYRIKEKYFLYKTSGKNYEDLKGKEVISINNKSIEEIISRIKPLLCIEGFNETGLNGKLQIFPFYYFLQDTSTVFNIKYADKDGKQVAAALPGIEYKSFINGTRFIVEPIEQAFKGDSIAILKVNTFYTPDFEFKKMDYKKYITDFFTTVKKKKISKLIIDVRNNSGGDSQISNYLFSFLTDKPYYYFEYVGRKFKNVGSWKNICDQGANLQDVDTSQVKLMSGLYCETLRGKNSTWWFKQQKPQKENYKGKLAVLINGTCFSTTGHFLTLLKDNGIGKFYGECSQGTNYSNDGSLVFELPYSGMPVRIPAAQFKMRTSYFAHDDKGICPDLEILPTKPEQIYTSDFILDVVIQTF